MRKTVVALIFSAAWLVACGGTTPSTSSPTPLSLPAAAQVFGSARMSIETSLSDFMQATAPGNTLSLDDVRNRAQQLSSRLRIFQQTMLSTRWPASVAAPAASLAVDTARLSTDVSNLGTTQPQNPDGPLLYDVGTFTRDMRAMDVALGLLSTFSPSPAA